LGDLVVYRNLEPCDARVPGLSKLRSRLGLEPGRIPRKAEPEYAAVVVQILRAAQALRLPGRPPERLLYLGDTVMNDRGAILNLRAYLPTLGFLGCDEAGEPRHIQTDEVVMTANRWDALVDFVRWVEGRGFVSSTGLWRAQSGRLGYCLDEETAAVIDLDKTAFGARGRNDGTIDAARVEAVRRTAEEVLGGAFDEATFLPIYNELKRPAYHPFTADNQDYLTYICLMASANVYPFGQLLDDLAAGRLASFAQFIETCNQKMCQEEGRRLLPVHREVYDSFRQGDPTPFKSFRYREYQATVARMDALPDETEPSELLKREIVLTPEVLDVARLLKERGVLLFGLTDKPDESSIPRPGLAQKGYLPLHRVKMKVMGKSIYAELDKSPQFL
jgi:hypothetical protein